MLLFGRSHNNSFTSRNYQKVCGVDIYTAAKEIKEMLKKGVVALPQKRGRVYNILALKEKRPTKFPDEYKILKETIQKKSFLKNEDIQRLLSIPRYKAKRLAQRLVILGFFEKEGKGKGTKYRMKQT